jgi:hypothetical protein
MRLLYQNIKAMMKYEFFEETRDSYTGWTGGRGDGISDRSVTKLQKSTAILLFQHFDFADLFSEIGSGWV